MTGFRKDIFAGLQVGRGAAAFMVLIFHAASILKLDGPVWTSLQYIGQRGVDFFFVLSGFIIYFIHRGDLGQPARLRAFALKRTLRIYPPYWVLIALYLVFYGFFLNDGAHDQLTWPNILKGLALYPIVDKPYNIPTAWTLSHELLFYILFATAILQRRAGIALMGLWGLAIAASLPFYPLSFPGSFIMNPRNLEFFLGIAVAHHIQTGKLTLPRTRAALLAGLGGFVAIAITEYLTTPFGNGPGVLLYGLASALLVYGLATLDRQVSLRYPAALMLTGNGSYSVYIVHFPVVLIGSKILLKLAPPEHALAQFLAVAALTVAGLAAGLIFHLVVERPLQKKTTQWAAPWLRKLPASV